ncbi:MAG: 50S ribosomal protein L22 [Thermoplasmata archaeon]|nr:MAG: 50S ribosomal protein L22 [Thermoplasmata archaeon]
MRKLGYSIKADPEGTAKAIGRELKISPKASVEVCREVKGMMVEDAVHYLEDIIALKRPVRYHRFNKQVGHRKGKKFGPGRYPKKTAKAILDVIRHAQHNAEYKGLDSDNMKIIHISSNRGMTVEGFTPRAHGRSTPFNHETANIEVVLEVVGE